MRDWAAKGLSGFCLLLSAVGCSGSGSRLQSPIEVAAPAETATPDGSEAPSTQPTQTFPELADEFLEGVVNKQNLDRFVEPSLGVFLITNPGAFQAVTQFPDFSSLAAEQANFSFGRLENQCSKGDWFTSDNRLPRYSCETEKYDIDLPCVRGTIHSDEVSRVLRLNVQYEQLPAVEGEQQIAAAKRSERVATHYIALPPFDLAFYFGQIDGKWRVLWVDAVEPCSA